MTDQDQKCDDCPEDEDCNECDIDTEAAPEPDRSHLPKTCAVVANNGAKCGLYRQHMVDGGDRIRASVAKGEKTLPPAPIHFGHVDGEAFVWFSGLPPIEAWKSDPPEPTERTLRQYSR